MGLDMYLRGNRQVREYKSEDKQLCSDINALLPKNLLVYGIDAEVGYWRKANAIHNWFVTNVQDGKDDCEEYDVSREQLEQLRQQCKIVLECFFGF